MIRNNLGAALQGLAVIPLYAGFDLDAADPTKAGRIFSFDVAGGVYEERSTTPPTTTPPPVDQTWSGAFSRSS
jgi:hypothetical protein